MTLPIILDCDPGHDDAVALLLALGSPELDLLGITVTHGNVPLDRTLRNALAVRDFAGAAVPVLAGADRPLIREPLYATHVHGQTGLGDVVLPDGGDPDPERAATFIADTVLARPGEVTLVAIGPLTNVALALRLEPRLAGALRGIVLMGGSADHGNVTPAAEFNFHADPHAARVVFESGVPVTMFGLNATRQVDVTDDRVATLRASGSRAADLASRFMEDYLGRIGAHVGEPVGALHDPCAVAYLVRPELFEVQTMRVEIDVAEGAEFGRSRCAVHAESVARVAVRADADGLYALLAERLARL